MSRGIVAPPRDGELTLRELMRYARIYDHISSGQHYPATEFVRWLRLEIQLSRERLAASEPW